ncbi:MAG: hypothetical protein M3459_13275 [Actinomycetota bacterium]|nr:hypothetical protein [Actinomycetota bacterium]
MAWDDDDDWVGTPPEGRHSRERADPGFWRSHRPLSIAGAAIVIVVIVVVLIVAG